MSDDEQDLDEAASFARKRIGAKVTDLILENPRGRPVDEAELGSRLAAIPGIERIALLQIGPSSRVKNLRFVAAAFPELRRLIVTGKSLETLEGIEDFRGDGVEIDTGTNKKRSVARLADATFPSLGLAWAGDGDTQALAGNRALRVLEVRKLPCAALSALGALPLRHLAVAHGRGEVLDVGALPAGLEEMHLYACSQLVRLTGEGKVTWLIVDACRFFDLETLAHLLRLKALSLVGVKQPIPLSVLRPLTELEGVSLTDCPVEVDRVELGLPRLRKLSALRLKRDQALALSRANPKVTISDAKGKLLAGAPI